MIAREAEAAVEADRRFEALPCAAPIPIEAEAGISQGQVRLGKRWVVLDGCGSRGFHQGRGDRRTPDGIGLHEPVAARQAGPRQRVLRLELDGAFQQVTRLRLPGTIESIEQRPPSEIEVLRVLTRLERLLQIAQLVWRQRQPDATGQVPGQLSLDGQGVVD